MLLRNCCLACILIHICKWLILVIVGNCFLDTTGWRRCIGCLIFRGRCPQKSPKISGAFAEIDLQLEASYASSTAWSIQVRVGTPQLACMYVYAFIYIYWYACIYTCSFIYMLIQHGFDLHWPSIKGSKLLLKYTTFEK